MTADAGITNASRANAVMTALDKYFFMPGIFLLGFLLSIQPKLQRTQDFYKSIILSIIWKLSGNDKWKNSKKPLTWKLSLNYNRKALAWSGGRN
jgi:hypothetical protein